MPVPLFDVRRLVSSLTADLDLPAGALYYLIRQTPFHYIPAGTMELLAAALGVGRFNLTAAIQANVTQDTPIGRLMVAYKTNEQDPPPELMIAMTARLLGSPDYQRGAILDDTPVNAMEADELAQFITIARLVRLEVTPADLVVRARAERICANVDCGAISTWTRPPERPPVLCSRCKTMFTAALRPVPAENTIEDHTKETASLMDFYGRAGVTPIVVNAGNDVDEATLMQALLAALKPST
jgi:adenylate kinase family enzyme